MLLHRLGQLHTRLHAAEALLLRAANRLDEAEQAITDETASVAAVEVGEAKAFAEEVAIEISSDIFALIGSAAADESLNLHRHWRNARMHTVHDANQWRYFADGNYLLTAFSPESPFGRSPSPDHFETALFSAICMVL